MGLTKNLGWISKYLTLDSAGAATFSSSVSAVSHKANVGYGDVSFSAYYGGALIQPTTTNGAVYIGYSYDTVSLEVGGTGTFKSSVQSNKFIVPNIDNGTSSSPYYSPVITNGISTNESSILFGNAFVNNAGTYMKFRVNSSVGNSTPIDALTINSLGNIGIGTTNPGKTLTISYSSAGNDALSIINTNTNGRSWYVGDGAGIAAGNFSIYDATAAALRFSIASSGAATFASSIKAKNAQIAGTSGGYTTGDNPMIGLGDVPSTGTFGTIEHPFGDKMKFNTYHGFDFKVANGGASPVTALLINSTRAATFASSITVNGGQITFPASQIPHSDPNTLDDYEEGSWSPGLAGTVSGVAVMNGITAGRYTKIGNKVTATAQIQWNGITGTITGNVIIQGLPFSSISGGSRCCGSMGAVASGMAFPSGYSGGWVYLMDPGTSFVYVISDSSTGQGYTHAPVVGSSGTVYALTITYFTI